jgi:hypothetical protein
VATIAGDVDGMPALAELRAVADEEFERLVE